MDFYKIIFIVTLLGYSNQQLCSSVNNMDIGLMNLTSHNNQEEANCCGICYKTTDCKGYAWNSYDGGTCWLKGKASMVISTSAVNLGVPISREFASISGSDVYFGKLLNVSKNEISATDFVKRKKRAEVKCPSLKLPRNGNYEVDCTFSTQHFELQSANCETESFIGVRATYRCKPYFKHVGNHSTASRICLPNGRWSALSNYFACDLDCGIKNEPKSETIASGVPSATEQWPWFAVIFRKDNENFIYKCGATLIAKNVILTSHLCVLKKVDSKHVEEEKREEEDSKHLKVVLNPVSSNFLDNYKNSGSQIFEVKQIIAHSDYNYSDFDNNVALIVLENEVEINDAVHPVCFPNARDGSNEIANQMLLPGSEGYAVGFWLENPHNVSAVMKEKKLLLVDQWRTEVAKWRSTEVTNWWESKGSLAQIFCAYNPNETSMPSDRESGGYGGGYYVGSYISGRLRYYVQGTLSYYVNLEEHDDEKSYIKSKGYIVCARLVSFQSWIVKTLQGIIESTKKIKCPFPKLAENSNVEVRCTFSSEHSEQRVMNCENETFVGVKATYSCKPYFTNTGSSKVITSVITCLPNGTWSEQIEVFVCGIDCGIKNKPKNKFITHGVSSSTEQWPWFAAIFRKERGNYPFICGGSLIAKNVILTASHCVTNEEGTALWSKLFTIVVGAVSSDLLENYENTRAQIIKVKEIISHLNYNPDNLEADIALLVLERDVIINDAVHPVCIPNGEGNSDEITRQMLITGSQGYVVGFGLDETWNISPTLKEIKLPLVTYQDCNEVLERRHTSTQICAGYTNGSSPCQGDSGGGLYFPSNIHGGRYYVQGIVSYGGQTSERRCDNKKYTVFTRLLSFQSWIVGKLQDVFSQRDGKL